MLYSVTLLAPGGLSALGLVPDSGTVLELGGLV